MGLEIDRRATDIQDQDRAGHWVRRGADAGH